MSSPSRRSSPRRAATAASRQDDENEEMIGKRTGVTLPPRGTIPLNSGGYEDIDAFWDAAKSPNPNVKLKDGKEAKKKEAREGKKRTAAEEKQKQLAELEAQSQANLKKASESLTRQSEGSTSKKYAISTPKDTSWSNRLLHKAMGIPTDDSPGTVLSRVSTAPPSARTTASLESVARQRKSGEEGVHLQSTQESPGEDENSGPMDPPEETDDKRGMDPNENDDPLTDKMKEAAIEPEEFDNNNDDESEDESNINANVSAKSSGITPDVENSMEELVERHDEYEGDEGGGFELATQEDGGFDNNYDDYEEEQVVSQKSKGKSTSDDDEDLDQKPKAKPEKDKSKKDKTPVTPTSVLRTKKSKKNKNQTNRVAWSTPNGTTGYPTGNREYEAVPISDYKDHPEPGQEPRTPGGTALRRSNRAKFKPLQFWKNEKLIYSAQNEPGWLGQAMGDMPVVTGVQQALPTPHKERVVSERKKAEKEKKGKKRRDNDDSDEEGGDGGPSARIPFDPTQLMKKRRINNGEHGSVWSETLEDTTELKVVSRLDNRSFSKLPLSTTRSKKESKVVGFASQSFHVPTDSDDLFPGYISGNVVLPPRGIKDAEGVGLCSQVFNVGDCQPNSVEFALADPSSADGEFDPDTAQRYLLSKGDMFQIPPGNVYRIENHSRTDKAALFWTIIKCTSRAEQESDDDS